MWTKLIVISIKVKRSIWYLILTGNGVFVKKNQFSWLKQPFIHFVKQTKVLVT